MYNLQKVFDIIYFKKVLIIIGISCLFDILFHYKLIKRKKVTTTDIFMQKKRCLTNGGNCQQGMQHKKEVTTFVVEQETRFELATPTLARLCSTS